jgi:hypothetical protein
VWLRSLISKRQSAIAEEQEAERNAVIRGMKDGIMVEELGRDVIVRYPVRGKVQEFRVTIDVMRRCGMWIQFSGRAHQKAVPGKQAWTGWRTFYSQDIVGLADPETGPVRDKEGYLEGLARLGRCTT